MIESKYIEIKEIECNDDYLYIIGDKKYISPIINGSVSFKIYDINMNEKYLSNINIKDRIKIYYKNNIIKKIIIQNKYEIISKDSNTSYIGHNLYI